MQILNFGPEKNPWYSPPDARSVPQNFCYWEIIVSETMNAMNGAASEKLTGNNKIKN